jgi:DNA-binding NtrC family response regulator
MPTGGADQGRSGLLGVRWVHPDVATSTTVFEGQRIVMGRSVRAESSEASAMSREHAEISKREGIYWIRDLDSRNGTFVNGRRCTDSPLALGDVIRLGDTLGVVSELTEVGRGHPAFEKYGNGLIAGPTLRSCLEPIFKIATTTLPILITGETGAGKEMVARALHDASRRSGPYRAINCAALPEPLAEGELFGYRKGAYTGASESHRGHLREADGGTLLLDEVGDLPLSIQAKLLRVLETKEVQPLGQAAAVSVDLRVIAATAVDLRRAVAEGRFRSDLLARLSGATVPLPPLRQRREEIVFICHDLMSRAFSHPPSISTGFAEDLCLHDWPHNVRELSLTAQRLAALFGRDRILSRRHLRAALMGPSSVGATPTKVAAAQPVDEGVLVAALRTNGGNLAKAAAALGLSRGRAYRMLRKIGLDSARREC